MKYYCKLVFTDKVEPTVDFTEKSPEELEAELLAVLRRFMSDGAVEGIYLGKRRP
jgi:hypothetical protein